MSSGSYRGGSSIIKVGGSFASFDPAETRNVARGSKKKATLLPKKAAKPQKPQSLSAQRNNLLNMAADANVSKKRKKLKFPKNTTDEVKRDVSRIGSIKDWASKQVGFDDLVKRKLEKKNARNSGSKPIQSLEKAEVQNQKALAKNKEMMNTKRIKKLRSEIAHAKDFIRVTEKEIMRLLESGGKILDE